MKDGFIRAVCAAPSLRVADCRYNVSQMIEAIKAAAKSKAKLLVFPELSVTGYTCGDLFGQKVLLDGAEEGLSRLLKGAFLGAPRLDSMAVQQEPIFEPRLI